MSYNLAFRACVEGPSDAEFFPALLTRAINGIVFELLTPPAEIDFDVFMPRLRQGETRHSAIVRQVSDNFGWTDVVFLHFDASADLAREQRKYWDPLVRSWPTAAAFPRLVPLAPRREMEAWAMADRHLLEDVVRHSWDAEEVFEGSVLEADVEALTDPKRTLEDVLSLSVRSRRSPPRPKDFLPLLAERIDLQSLDRLPSYISWRSSTTHALKEVLRA